jgi:hypothetical protein
MFRAGSAAVKMGLRRIPALRPCANSIAHGPFDELPDAQLQQPAAPGPVAGEPLR